MLFSYNKMVEKTQQSMPLNLSMPANLCKEEETDCKYIHVHESLRDKSCD